MNFCSHHPLKSHRSLLKRKHLHHRNNMCEDAEVQCVSGVSSLQTKEKRAGYGIFYVVADYSFSFCSGSCACLFSVLNVPQVRVSSVFGF